MCIATKKVLVRGGAVDQIGWLLNTERQFIVKSAYEIVGPGVNVATDPIWANIHRFNGLLRIKDFLWLVFKGKIMTNVERVLRGFAVDVRCLRCLMEPEDHLLRVHNHGPSCVGGNESSESKLFGSFMCRMGSAIWGYSSVVFEMPSDDCRSILERSRSLVWSTQRVLTPVSGVPVAQREGSRETVHWKPPPPGWFLVNTDRARHLESGRATCGGVIVEVDSEYVLRLIYPSSDQGRYLSVVNHIAILMPRDWVVQCRRIPRSGNKIADALAKLADSSHLNCCIFLVSPSTVLGLLQEGVSLHVES
ncbi:hypothetical protein V6N11_059563 [Hibiscus sabdariffa]|uniref:RNase H type-1 domain-containing protein n=1 Tax=Hibiscus sabdariffa TaxID=183260 RepID=A0ABR2NP38_9ROSI